MTRRSRFLFVSTPLLLLFLPQEVFAVPAFVRQTGLECMMCHTQNQTKLNSFGRQFARSAYTMSSESGAQSLIDGETLGLGIPTVLNMSLMLKGRYDKSDGAVNGKGKVLQTKQDEPISSNRGVEEIFKTSTIHIAGRIANNVGSIIEFREKEGKAIFGGKVATAYETGEGYTGLAFYSTNNYGPFSGIESYNTGLYKPLRQFENHKLTNAAQASDLGSGPATGLQLYYAGEHLFLTVGAYVPVHNNDGIDIGYNMIPFARLAYEQPIGDLTLIIGAFGINGTSKASNTTYYPDLSGLIPEALVGVKKEAYGFDLQLEGSLFELSTLMTMSAVLKNKTTLSDSTLMVDDPNNPVVIGEPEDAETEAYSVDLAIYPWTYLGFKMAYLTANDKGPHTYEPQKIDVKDKEAVSFGLDYSFRQNVMLTMEYTMVDAKREGIENFNDLLTVLTISF